MSGTFNVIFLCKGNAVRSIMAESILRHEGGPNFRAFSAGFEPRGEVDPHALGLLREAGYPTEGLQSKSWDRYASGQPFDLAITVCDQARCEIAPAFCGDPAYFHWSIDDPMLADEARREDAMLLAFAYLRRRIQLLVSLPVQTLLAKEPEWPVSGPAPAKTARAA